MSGRRRRAEVRVRAGCPTPDKQAFRSRSAAERRAGQLGLFVVPCACSMWHLTSKKPTGKWAER